MTIRARAHRSQRMGALFSRRSLRTWNWNGPPGDHSPFPLDPVPYPGSNVFYCFEDIMVSFKFMSNNLNLGPQVVTTNIENNLAEIQDSYQHGFMLNAFVKIPCIYSTKHVQDWTQTQPFQAILSMPGTNPDDQEVWDLAVHKCIVSTKTLSFEEMDDEYGLMTIINRYAEQSGRLACVQPVGFVRSSSTNQQYGVIGAELFFNVPRHPEHMTTKYVYEALTIPAHYHIVPDATQTIQQVVCDADFMKQMKLYLGMGWKLVDICMDTSGIAEAYQRRVNSQNVDTLWIFEKDAFKLEDPTPEYEGVIIEYLHKIKVGFDGESAARDWRPVIAGMGVSGWELVSIIQTPLVIQSNFTTYTMKLLMVFQRKVIPGYERLKQEKMASNKLKAMAKADFLKLKSPKSQPDDGFFGTLRGNASPASYYRESLERPIPRSASLSNGQATLIPNGPVSPGTPDRGDPVPLPGPVYNLASSAPSSYNDVMKYPGNIRPS